MVIYRCTMADQQQQQERCAICGSRFAEKNATFVKAEYVRRALYRQTCPATLLNVSAATGKR